ncbi:MAG: leucyl/phenylalanyl-tRNA--protein transferase, partial [Saprospiraceae bacterium]|nr:leucyl/phenylalanyl-tRNA--protein transferase [Saprospiraceae bacterium]
MPIFWLDNQSIAFPNPELANEQGVLAVGGDLSINRLILAYSQGIFPWYNPEDPILWWSPDPRFVLFPEELKVSKSMRPYFNNQKYAWSIDRAFEEVIKHCQQNKRKGQNFESWITDEMKDAYIKLHEA